MNRPIVMLAATLMLPKKIMKPTNEYTKFLSEDNTWRLFVGLPIVFSIIFMCGMIFIIKTDTPMFLMSKKRYSEA